MSQSQQRRSSPLPILKEESEKPSNVEEDQNGTVKMSLPFVPALEGLRGVAVLLTEYVHIGLDMDTVPLGTAGVTIFFVLSGYLITGVLLKLQITHKSSPRRLLRFYNDRSVRLYPALLIMVLGITIFRYYWTAGNLPGHTYADMSVALTYMVDSRFLFIQSWKVSQFPNVWSLSVEEKFYIFWSLALPTIINMSEARRKLTMTTLISVSFGLQIVGYLRNPIKESLLISRYSAAPNIFKMLVGAWLRLSPAPSLLRRRWSSWFGLLATALPVFLAKYTKPIDITAWSFPPRHDLSFEIIWEIWPTFTGAMMVCGCIEHGNWLLESHPLRFIGRISYAWYLWQLPLLLVITGQEPWEHGYHGITTSALAFVIAMASTIYIEEPVRNAYHRWKTSGHQMIHHDRDGRIA